MKSGILYIVSTPIGNMGDITLRAIEVLKNVDYILAEDTREIGKLLKHLEIPKKDLISYRDQNHDRVVSKILDLLNSGNNLALVSDRGTPTISDPGFKLVRDVVQHGVQVVSVPGASALLAALAISGLPTDKFTFLGFLPRTPGKQKTILKQFNDYPSTFVIYESPYRVVKVLKIIQETLGNIDVAVARELTKMHEEILRGNISEVLKTLESKTLKGEFVIICNNR